MKDLRHEWFSAFIIYGTKDGNGRNRKEING